MPADLADPGDIAELERVVAAAEPDLLVNNAGFGGYREFCDVDPQVVADLVGVHVLAVSRLARAAIPAMIARGSGAIINVASLLAFSGTVPPQPLPCRAVYAWRQGLPGRIHPGAGGRAGRDGVQVQVCCPGLIDTEFHAVAGMALAGIPFPVLRPGEVARAALAGLRLAEVVCVPGLPEPSMIDTVSRSAAGAAHDRGEFGAGRPLCAGSRGVTGELRACRNPGPQGRRRAATDVYALGRDPGESARLQRQSEELRSDSTALLDRAGLRPGQSAIDLQIVTMRDGTAAFAAIRSRRG